MKEKQTAIEVQKKEFRRWSNLHDLIGSADGKRYRNFAQTLTFEMMIGHANRQLQKMTDRYLLVRNEAQPLDLDVIDNYQAGEIRSTKNLSGGESFIVSLSLALGLSHMASKNVRVDSEISQTEIIKAGTRAYVQVDMSSAPEPESNSMLAGIVEIDLGQPTQIPEFRLIGSPVRRFDIFDGMLSVATA